MDTGGQNTLFSGFSMEQEIARHPRLVRHGGGRGFRPLLEKNPRLVCHGGGSGWGFPFFEENPRLVPNGGGPDLISVLPEELLLHVLRRLGCARAATRTSLLSRPWRGLWTGLPDLIFRDISVRSIQAALSSLQQQGASVSLLDVAIASSLPAPAAEVSLPYTTRSQLRRERLAADVTSLLHAAAGLSPVEFRLAFPICMEDVDAELPAVGFHRTTSIQVYAPELIRLIMPPRSSGVFPKLQKLTLSGCTVDVAALVLRCPCLRELRLNGAPLDAHISIHSESLQKLSVRTKRYMHDMGWTDSINVEAPMLEQLAVSVSSSTDITVSVVAPILDKVFWDCSYDRIIAVHAFWGLSKVRLYPAESLGQRAVRRLQLANLHVLSLQLSCGRFNSELNFRQRIEKHLVTDFSILDLTMGYSSMVHVFGPFVLHLLGMCRIRTAIRRLQLHFMRPKGGKRCQENCSCDEPKNWRSKNISLTNLEEVEIKGFDGEDHEFEFLQVIFRSTPMLKRMVVRTSDEVRTSSHQCTKIQDIFNAYPFVECKLFVC